MKNQQEPLPAAGTSVFPLLSWDYRGEEAYFFQELNLSLKTNEFADTFSRFSEESKPERVLSPDSVPATPEPLKEPSLFIRVLNRVLDAMKKY